MKKLDGKLVSGLIEEKLAKQISKLNVQLKLAVIRIGNDPASEVYINMKYKASQRVGILFESFHLEDAVSETKVEELIQKLNDDDSITGILLQLPLPNNLNAVKLVNLIDPKKDVDGLTITNQGKLWQGIDGLVPCTPLGVMELLNYYKIKMSGKKVVIVGRSLLVGKPLAALFTNADATITLCHSKTPNLKSYTKQADIVVLAAGHPNLLTTDMIKSNAVIIDVSINRENNHLVGDASIDIYDMPRVRISPVPGGVGPMTVAMLLSNVYMAYTLLKK